MNGFKLNIQLFSQEGEALSEGAAQNGAEASENGAADLTGEESFEELIGGKFKKEFPEKVQGIIDKRFKKTKELERFYDDAAPLLNALGKKYGTDTGDFKSLSSAIFEKNENGAPKKGGKAEAALSADEPKTEITVNDESEYAKRALMGLVAQGEGLKELYPDFDLRKELSGNPLFSRLLKNGVGVKDAFETVHKDELISGAMAYAAKTVREQMASSLELKNSRPLENGLLSSSAAVTKRDVNSLTQNDILEIIKQVEKGAKIEF